MEALRQQEKEKKREATSESLSSESYLVF